MPPKTQLQTQEQTQLKAQQKTQQKTNKKKKSNEKSKYLNFPGCKYARGEGAQKVWDHVMSPESELYESMLEKFNEASEEEQNAAKDELNEFADGFGDAFYDSKSNAMLAWADLTEEDRD